MAAFRQEMHKNGALYLLALPGLLLFIVFSYIPMFGIVIAFQKYNPARGFFHSDWVGLRHFINFFKAREAWSVLRNTLLLNVYGLVFGFPIPILFALALNELRSGLLRRVVQTVSCLPNFLSNVIVVGIVVVFLAPERGIVNQILAALGGEKIYFLIEPKYFRFIYTVTNIWKGFGWGAVIYLAAIVGINQEFYESAMIDGATRLQRIRYITLPCIKSTVVISLILSLSSILSSNFEMVYLLYNPLTYQVSDVISTYLYRRGLTSTGGMPEYSFAAAVGFLKSLVGCLMVVLSNWTARRLLGSGIY